MNKSNKVIFILVIILIVVFIIIFLINQNTKKKEELYLDSLDNTLNNEISEVDEFIYNNIDKNSEEYISYELFITYINSIDCETYLEKENLTKEEIAICESDLEILRNLTFIEYMNIYSTIQ